MNKKEKEELIAIMGFAGFMVILIGIFFEDLDFLHALAIALALWVLSGVAKKYLEVEKKK